MQEQVQVQVQVQDGEREQVVKGGPCCLREYRVLDMEEEESLQWDQLPF